MKQSLRPSHSWNQYSELTAVNGIALCPDTFAGVREVDEKR